jgi:hypothetical protein
MLGPASLAYLDASEFRPRPDQAGLEPLHPQAGELVQFLSATDPVDLDESGIEQITSPAFAVREHGQIVAVAGYRDWPGQVAHLSVLTAAQAAAVASLASPHRPPSPRPSARASCRSGEPGRRLPGVSRAPSAFANSDPRPASGWVVLPPAQRRVRLLLARLQPGYPMTGRGSRGGRKLYAYFLAAGIPAPQVALIQPLRIAGEEKDAGLVNPRSVQRSDFV